MQQFDVKTVKINGKNLIEASAGTGKTYSIAILVLRVLMETNIKIKELLLVTFTDAAVAELDERVRKFLRTAYRYAEQQTKIEDKTISEMVDLAISQTNKEDVLQKLHDALVFLDEVQITTIHGFCNYTQKQFAFETDQLFDKELLADESLLIDEAIHQFWRTEITGLPVEYLKVLFESKFGREEIQRSVKNSLNGFVFKGEQKDLNEVFTNLQSQLKTQEEKNEAACGFVSELEDVVDQLGRSKAGYKKLMPTPEEFVLKFCGAIKEEKDFVDLFPTEFIALGEELVGLEESINLLRLGLKGILHHQIIDYVTQKLASIKKQKSLQSYNDMISGLHTAITSEHNERLIKQLKKRYKVVFIDEFQDTDKVQYDIFYEAFGNQKYDELEGVYPTTVFYIGDPKQSIYAFRQANLKTYSMAKETSQVFDMDTNFRSVPDYVEAMNVFFEPTKGYPFFKDERIKYIPVKPSSKWKENQELKIRGIECKPFSFVGFGYQKAKEAYANITYQVLELLKDGKIADRKIVPNDIGILVRTGSQARDIKDKLSEQNIPAIVVDDSQVLKSDEAKSVRYILEAILEQDRSNLNRVLLTPFTFYSHEELMQLDMAAEISRFAEVVETFKEFGVYPALITFLELYESADALQFKIAHKAGRALSNFTQLAEICNQRQLRYNDDLPSLITWLQKEFERTEKSSEYEQRLESDRNAVNIVTIHKSKGLDYNVVFTYFPQGGGGHKDTFVQYQNEETAGFEYVFKDFDEEKEALKETQEAQEMMRLWYVAITRAVYKSYIYYDDLNKKREADESKIIATHKTLLLDKDQYFEDLGLDVVDMEPYEPEKELLNGTLREANKTVKFKSDWTISSYSSIRKKEEHHVSTKVVLDDLEGYEEFVFHEMPRGANFGNFMHLIFEQIDFEDKEQIHTFLNDKIGTPFAHKLLTEETISDYEELVHQVVQSVYTDEKGNRFHLSEVTEKLPEMEFFFDVNDFNEVELKQQFDKPFSFEYNSYSGFVNGFVDLIFEKNGRYYILDWKSNHLGDNIEAYNAEAVEQAMTDANYHLQYFIYTISVCRYLKQINPNFDYDRDFGGVFYVFVRGCRAGESTGVFYNKPSWESVEGYL